MTEPELVQGPSTLLDLDAGAALEAVQSIAGDSLRSVVEFDTARVNLLYIDEGVEQTYGDIETVYEMAETMHRRMYLDLVQAELMKGENPIAGDVYAFATYMENLTQVRVWRGDRGLLITFEPDVCVREVLDELASTFEAD